MPQLDPVSFLSQFFWLCIVFSSLYLILVKFCLPRIARIFKVREFIQARNLQEINEINSATPTEKAIPAIDSSVLLMTETCFSQYPDLVFDTNFLADSNFKCANELELNHEKTLITDIILGKLKRVNSLKTLESNSEVKGTALAIQLIKKMQKRVAAPVKTEASAPKAPSGAGKRRAPRKRRQPAKPK